MDTFVYYYDIINEDCYIGRNEYELYKKLNLDTPVEARIIEGRNTYKISKKSLSDLIDKENLRPIENIVELEYKKKPNNTIIVYEDDDLMVVNKPRGMVVHPAIGNYTGTLVNAIMYHAGDRLSSINGVVRPGIVHRIDKDTSGLLVIAKNNKAHESLSAQLKEHSINRRYIALVYDNIVNDNLTIDAPIGRDPRNRLRKKVNGEGERTAVTHVKVLERYGKYTLCEMKLETGRTHQIRVHMAYIKHPLVGDPLYGPAKQPAFLGGQMLHAKILGFVHPTTGEYMEFEAELPEYFTDNMKRLGIGV